MDEPESSLDFEIELLQSSLLAEEQLEVSDGSPRTIEITSSASKLALHISIDDGYPAVAAVHVAVKGAEVNRDEAEGWRAWIQERMTASYSEDDDYPLYQLLTTHILPILAPSTRSPSPAAATPAGTAAQPLAASSKPHHALLTSHHLLSNTKRKDLIALSSSLSLVGFAKRGHPGIYYATGSHDDLTEWIREVKSWNWLALRVRMTPEPIPGQEEAERGRGGDQGARGGKGRGEWVELDKISEALDWLRARRREDLLLDIGMGGASGKA